MFDRLKGGLRYLNENPMIFMFGFLTYMLFAFTLVNIHVVLPSYVHDFLQMGGNIYASAEVYYSIGAIFSGILILRIFRHINPLKSIMILMSFVAIAFFLMLFGTRDLSLSGEIQSMSSALAKPNLAQSSC